MDLDEQFPHSGYPIDLGSFVETNLSNQFCIQFMLSDLMRNQLIIKELIKGNLIDDTRINDELQDKLNQIAEQANKRVADWIAKNYKE